jgi:hypothetical protein
MRIHATKILPNGDYNTAITKCEFKGYEVLMPKTKRKHIFVQWFIKE